MLNSKEIASIAIFGAIAAVVTTFTKLPIFHYPIIPVLRFDMGEIIDFLAFLIVGPVGGIIVAFIHFLTLLVISGAYAQVPVASQLMKLFAVTSTMLGFMMITRVRSPIIALSFAILGRVLIMAVANYLFFFVFFPFTLKGVLNSIALATGIQLSGFFYEVLLVLLFTGIFNAIHAVITCSIPLYLFKRYPQVVSLASSIKPVWVVRYFKQ